MGGGGGEPVSRFWACLFSPGIFALLWTLKMGVTRKWLLAIAGPWAMPVVVAALVDAYAPTGLLKEVAVNAMVVGAFGIPVFATAIPFMHKWATEYNLERFGHASKRGWKRAQREAAAGAGAPAGAGAGQGGGARARECPRCHRAYEGGGKCADCGEPYTDDWGTTE